jgi:nicotinamidase-related amidase
MNRSDTGLLIIDLQEKLLGAIPEFSALIRRASLLLSGAQILGLPVLATEQYPKGLGRTHPDLLAKLETPLEKLDFSCAALGAVSDFFKNRNIQKILLIGVETHVCVLQTALDLAAQGFQVYGAVDAMGSRSGLDHELGLKRMEKAGVTLTTVETALFEWTERAGTPDFKEISRLIKDQKPA